MTLYRKKILRKNTYKQIKDNRESRDAIVYDVLSSQRKARVYIQGCSNLVVVDIPSNVETKPQWLKPGASVRIAHVKGVRGNMQIVGTGHFLPTSAEGSTFSAPKSSTDAIIYGMLLQENPDNSTKVAITSGKYRIGGEYYTFNAETSGLGFGMTMEEGSTIVMSSDSTEIMQSIDDSIAYFVDIDPNESSTLYRIDILVIGNDYQVDYIKGDLFNPASGPAIPDIPIGHLLIGKINIPPNTSEINKYMINTEFAEAVPKSLETINKKHYATLSSGDKKGDGLVAVFNEIMYPEGQPPPTQRALVDIVILDQYGNTFVAPEGGINLIARTINYEFYRDQINAIWISEGDDHAIGADRDVYKYLQVPPDGSGELLSLQGSNVTPAGGGFARLTNGYGGGSPEIASASYPNTPYSAIPFEYDNPSMISPNNKIPHHEIELRFSEGDVCMTTIEAWYAVSVSPLSSIIKIYVKEYPDISYTYPLYYFELFAESPSPFY